MNSRITLRKTEVSFVSKVGNSLFVFKWNVRILVSVSTKSKYSILKCSLSFGYLKQHCCMGITLLTKEITPKNISIEMKFNIGMMCLQKGR